MSAHAVALDSSDNAYVNRPRPRAQPFLSPRIQRGSSPRAVPMAPAAAGLSDAFVTVIKADGSGYRLLVLSGRQQWHRRLVTGIAVDSSGNAYVTGETASTNASTKDFPLQSALQGTYRGAVQWRCIRHQNECDQPEPAMVNYSTYLGGSGNDLGANIAVDSGSGTAYVTGQTSSSGSFNRSSRLAESTFQHCPGRGTSDAFMWLEINSARAQQPPFSTTYLGGTGELRTPAAIIGGDCRR